MNFGELKSAVQSNIGRTDKTSLIETAINLALDEMAKVQFFRDLRTESDLSIVADDTSVALPSTTFQNVEARLINTSASLSHPIMIMGKSQFVKIWPDVDELTSGTPDVAYIEGNVMYFNCKASQSFTIRVTSYALPADLSSDSDEHGIRGADLFIIQWATFYLFKSLEQFDKADQWLRDAGASLLTLKRADNRRLSVEPHTQEIEVNPQPPQYWYNPFVKRV